MKLNLKLALTFVWLFICRSLKTNNIEYTLIICKIAFLNFVDRNGLAVDLQGMVFKAVEESMNKLRAGFARDVASETKADILR